MSASPRLTEMFRQNLLPIGIPIALLVACWLGFSGERIWSQEQGPDQPAASSPRGDGLTDDTDALQAAIDAGDTLTLEQGVYRLTRPLVVELRETGPWSLQGNGVARLQMEGSGPAILVIGTHEGTAAPGTVRPEVWDRQRMPLIDGIEIVGRHPEASGIELAGTMQPTLTRITVRDCLHGIHLTQRNRNVQISDCHLYDNRGIGVFLDGVNLHQINIVGSHISYNDQGGIVARKSEIRNLQIGTCDIEGNMGGPDSDPSANVDLDSTGSSIGEVAIVGCTIQHAHDTPGSANIRINGRSTAREFTEELRHGHVTIANNVLSDVQTNIELAHVRGAAITGNTLWKGYTHNLLMRSCDSVVVTGNVFDDNPRYHYGDGSEARLAVVLEDCTDCLLSSNLLKGTHETDAAVSLTRCGWTTLADCQVLDYDGQGILLTDCHHCRVSNCVVEDRRSDQAGDRGIVVKGKSSSNVIETQEN